MQERNLEKNDLIRLFMLFKTYLDLVLLSSLVFLYILGVADTLYCIFLSILSFLT